MIPQCESTSTGLIATYCFSAGSLLRFTHQHRNHPPELNRPPEPLALAETFEAARTALSGFYVGPRLSEVSRRSTGLLAPGVLMPLITDNPICAKPRFMARHGAKDYYRRTNNLMMVAGTDFRHRRSTVPGRPQGTYMSRISLRIHHQKSRLP